MTSSDPVHLPAIAILGAGSMGRAILGGILAPHVATGGVRVTGRDAQKLADLIADDRVAAATTAEDADANRSAVRDAGVVIVAVKPAGVPALLDEIADALDENAVVVSVAAGVAIATMEARLPASVAVIRAMPNTPAMIGRGVTGLSAGARSSAEQLDTVSALFGTVGDVLVVPESQLDALSSISGSGPAYVFLFIESFMAAAIEQGFTHEQSRLMVAGTFAGASELLLASGETPEELRRRVTSPRGTTERAIEVLESADLEELFVAATSAAVARARELAAEAASA